MTAAGLPGTRAAVSVPQSGRSIMLRARWAGIAVGAGGTGNHIASHNTHDIARASGPSGTAAHVIRSEYAGAAAWAARADGKPVTTRSQIDSRHRFACPGAAAARTAAAPALLSAAGAAAAAISE